MAKISLYLDNRRKGEEKSPLRIRISQGNATTLITTTLKIDPQSWDIGSSSVIVTDHETSVMADEVLALKRKIGELSASARRYYDSDEEAVRSLRDLYKEAIPTNGSKYSEKHHIEKGDASHLFLARLRAYRDACERHGTWEVYDRTVRAILVFDPDAEKKPFEKIDLDWIKAFEAHCKAKGMKVNSISILMRNIRTVFNEAVRAGITQASPFYKFTIRQEATRKRSLSLEDLRRLASMKVETWHEEYRDMFFLSFMLLGINMADLLSLKPEDMHDGRIEFKRLKTGTEYSIKVEPEARALIEKYRGTELLLAPLERYRCAKDYIQHMDRALKQMGRKTGKKGKILSGGIFPDLTSYWARHSWATLAYELDIPVDVIAQGLGHKNREHRITMVYIRQNRKKVDEANRQGIDALLGIQRQEVAAAAQPIVQKEEPAVQPTMLPQQTAVRPAIDKQPDPGYQGGFVSSGTFAFTMSW